MSHLTLPPLPSQFLSPAHPFLQTPLLLGCLSPRSRPTKTTPTPIPTLTLTPTAARSIMSSNSWWRRAAGQSFNLGRAAAAAAAAAREPRLALPHLAAPDIGWVDWAALRRLGFRGVVFDKDNTLTAPYAPALWPPLVPALRRCRDAFPPGALAIFSNSIGLRQFDPDGSEANLLEEAIGGIHTKKPAGTAAEIEKYFGCSASHLVMVGDRHFTDILYGNRNGFLTILTEPLCPSEDPFIVKMVCCYNYDLLVLLYIVEIMQRKIAILPVRRLEGYLVSHWYKKGLKPIKHALLTETKNLVKDPSLGRGRRRKKPLSSGDSSLTASGAKAEKVMGMLPTSSELGALTENSMLDQWQTGHAFAAEVFEGSTHRTLLIKPGENRSTKEEKREYNSRTINEDGFPNKTLLGVCENELPVEIRSASSQNAAPDLPNQINMSSPFAKDIASPRIILCLGHNRRVAWDVKWRPCQGNSLAGKTHMGYLAVLLGNGILEVWDIPLPGMVQYIYSYAQSEGTDPHFVKLELVFRSSKGEMWRQTKVAFWKFPSHSSSKVNIRPPPPPLSCCVGGMKSPPSSLLLVVSSSSLHSSLDCGNPESAGVDVSLSLSCGSASAASNGSIDIDSEYDMNDYIQ
ncbi:Phosphatidylglycerophosphatase GEP4, mitochondrial, partial [Ananas comosus]